MNKVIGIFLSLHEKTKRGEIKWEETENAKEFQVAFPTYSIRIGSQEGQYGLPVYYLKIFNQEGKLIEEIGQDELGAGVYPIGPGPGARMQELYELARRIAMRVEEALDSILSELEGKVERGPKK